MKALTRIFINHPTVGTIEVPKSRPHFKSHRYSVMNRFMWALSQAEFPKRLEHYCKRCNKMLLNPQSILMHIGNCCENKLIVNK